MTRTAQGNQIHIHPDLYQRLRTGRQRRQARVPLRVPVDRSHHVQARSSARGPRPVTKKEQPDEVKRESFADDVLGHVREQLPDATLVEGVPAEPTSPGR